MEIWTHELRYFLEHIQDWCVSHADKVLGYDIGIGYDEYTIVIVMKSGNYDFDFDDQITDLDCELVQDYPNFPADVFQSPFELEEKVQCQIRL